VVHQSLHSFFILLLLLPPNFGCSSSGGGEHKHKQNSKHTITMRDSAKRQRRRLAILTVLTWWSTQQHDVEASRLSLQHRVPSSQRDVPYQHVLSGQPRDGKHARVHHGDSFAVTRTRQLLHKELHDDDDLWVLHVTAKLVSDKETNNIKTRRRKLGGSTQPLSQQPSLWRRLFDQFVGQETTPGLENLNGTNVTTEVEFESIIDNSSSSNSSEASENDEESNVPPSTATSNVTTITGNATEAGNITASIVYTKPADDLNSTSGPNNLTDANDTTEYQPLRIRAILAEDSGRGHLLNETERNALFHDMLSPALLAWSSSLRVDPVVGNLTVDVNQLVDGETCGPGIDSGLPSIQVPLHHIYEGIPETDMIVYLSLGFVIKSEDDEGDSEDEVLFDNTFQGNTSSASGTDIDEEIDDEEQVVDYVSDSRDGWGGTMREWLVWGERRNRRLTDSNGTDETDSPSMKERAGSLIDEVQTYTNETNGTEPINICTGAYLAAASYCSSDQYDRPTAALLHICIDDTFFDPKHLQRNILTIMHELGHALGFNSLSMAHFRKPDGTPYTRRDKNGNVPEKTIECTGAETEHQVATVPLPSEDILKFREVRGGVRVAEIVTPSVLQVVRNQFDCQLLTGAELESGEGLPLSVTGEEGCIGNHWERRLFSSDLMNPVVDDLEYSTRISTLTLAYFADSGWYQVDLSNADVASGWGRGAGCNFVNDTCINANGEVPPQNAPFFCNEIASPTLTLSSNIHGCTPDLSRKATCSIGQYDLDLPPAYQYFNSTYGADVGGSDTFMDFCVSFS
jgi:Leishmanolysin